MLNQKDIMFGLVDVAEDGMGDFSAFLRDCFLGLNTS